MAERRRSNKEPTPSSTEQQLQYYALWMHGINAARNVLMTGVIGASLWAIVYTGVYLPVRDAAGKETILKMTQQWMFDANVHVYLAWGAAATATGLAVNERRKKLKERKEKDDRIIGLEKQIDPHRTSSGLTTEGERREKLP